MTKSAVVHIRGVRKSGSRRRADAMVGRGRRPHSKTWRNFSGHRFLGDVESVENTQEFGGESWLKLPEVTQSWIPKCFFEMQGRDSRFRVPVFREKKAIYREIFAAMSCVENLSERAAKCAFVRVLPRIFRGAILKFQHPISEAPETIQVPRIKGMTND